MSGRFRTGGVRPFGALLERRSPKIKSTKDLIETVGSGRLREPGDLGAIFGFFFFIYFIFFFFYGRADEKQKLIVLRTAAQKISQGGMGLPDRDYYGVGKSKIRLRNLAKFVNRHHVAKIFGTC